MDEQKECNITGNHPHHPSNMKEFEQQFQLLRLERSHINTELTQQKAGQYKINQKLRRFSNLDKIIEWKMLEIKTCEYFLGKVELGWSNSVQGTTCFIRMPGEDAQTTVRPDYKKRCKKRLIKKGRVDIEYLEEVKEIKDMMESMVQRIQHGNKKRADEMKMYQELSKFKKTIESYIQQEPRSHWCPREGRSKRDTDQKRSEQRQLNFLLDDLEKLKGEQIGRESRVRRLKAELEHLTRNIIYLNKKLEKVDSKIHQAYKRAYC